MLMGVHLNATSMKDSVPGVDVLPDLPPDQFDARVTFAPNVVAVVVVDVSGSEETLQFCCTACSRLANVTSNVGGVLDCGDGVSAMRLVLSECSDVLAASLGVVSLPTTIWFNAGVEVCLCVCVFCDLPGCELQNPFRDKACLERHKRSVHREVLGMPPHPYKCRFPGCTHSYSWKAHLNRHMRAAHGIGL